MRPGPSATSLRVQPPDWDRIATGFSGCIRPLGRYGGARATGKWRHCLAKSEGFFGAAGPTDDDDDELNTNPPTPCLGKRPQRPKPKGPGRPCRRAHRRAPPPRTPPGRHSCGLWPWVTGPTKAGFVVASKKGNLLIITIQKEKENKKRNKQRTRREVSLTKTSNGRSP